MTILGIRFSSSPFSFEKNFFVTYDTLTPLAIIIVLTIATAMEKETESATTEIEEENGNYRRLTFIRAPKKNHQSIKQIGKLFVQ